MAGALKCHTGYKISWKIDNFKFLHNSASDYKNSPQIFESDHFIMWDCNWKFKLTLEQRYSHDGYIRVNTSLEVLDVESWDEKGLSVSASLKAIYQGGDISNPENKDYSSPEKLKDHKFNYVHVFNFSQLHIFERIRHTHDFDFTWTIWQEVDSNRYKRYVSNVKRIKLMVNKWGLMLEDTANHDVKIRCQGVDMTAHKVVLSGSSTFFKAMFQSDMKETRESLVEVTVGSPEAVKVMLRWIYGSTGDFEEKEAHALDLLKLAHYYDLEGLMEECQLILVEKLCKENVIEMLKEALGAKELKASAIQFIIRNKSDFLEDLKTKLKQNLVVEILMAH